MATDITQSLLSFLPELRANTIVLENSDELQLEEIQDGMLLVYATWSAPAIANCIQTIKILYLQEYSGKIIVIDADKMPLDFQIDILGQVCHGWGEIFKIQRGEIKKSYLGKDCFSSFKNDFGK